MQDDRAGASPGQSDGSYEGTAAGGETVGLRQFRRDEVGTIGVGLVGLGPRGQFGWVKSLKLLEAVRIVAVAEPVEALRLEGAARAGLEPKDAYADVDDLLARPDVDAVAVVVEPRNIADLVVRALEAGKHVICEVPLALTLKDCWRVVLAAERSGRKMAMAEQLCYAPFVFAWRRLYEQGQLGSLSYGEAQYINGKGLNRYWLDDKTGRMLDWAESRAYPDRVKTHFWDLHHSILYNTHSLSPLMRVLDERIARVTGMVTPRPSRYLRDVVKEDVDLPDLEVALMQTVGGTILRVAVGFVSPYPGPEPHHYLHFIGTKGEVETGRHRAKPSSGLGADPLMWLADQFMPGRSVVEWSYSPYDPVPARALASGHGGLDYYPIHDFAEAILDDRSPVTDQYRAADLAAPGVLAGVSEERGSIPLDVPDFRPGPGRARGQAPAESIAFDLEPPVREGSR